MVLLIEAPPPTNLIGHSGSIFGLDISNDSSYIISGSEDKTSII
jgi:WD40 repeat protein